jgi:hypothetical protein
MKLKYKINDKVELEIEGEGQKEVFKELSAVQEIFGEKECGLCKKQNLKFVVRNVESNDYFEIRCGDCGGILSFGQHKKGGTLFPKRKGENNEYLPNNGWHKWQPKND